MMSVIGPVVVIGVLWLVIGYPALLLKRRNETGRWRKIKPRPRRTKPVELECPRCSTPNRITPTPCENCDSTNTRVELGTAPRSLVLYCLSCQRWGWYDYDCTSCGTDLGRLFRSKGIAGIKGIGGDETTA